jgi:hypothetical protein
LVKTSKQEQAIATMGIKLGNPAPLGLLAFGMTTMMLMYVDMGWVETEFEEMVAGYAMMYGGLGQLLVAIFELFKGASFSFAVFGSYGAFWLGWALVFLQNKSLESEYTADYTDGKTAWFIQWGVLTFCFWLIALRKNLCLIAVLGLLSLTFFVLAAASGSGDANVKKAAGYCGFFTAVAAWYTAIAELVNEEFGYHLLPGLKPILKPEQFQITKESIIKKAQYDKKTNTIFLQFRGIQVKTTQDVTAIQEGLEEAFENAAKVGGEGKVHVVVDYEDVLIADNVFNEYWEMVGELERKYYLSAKRFHVTSFGTGSSAVAGDATGMRKVRESWITPPTDQGPPRSNRSLKAEQAM